MITLLCPEYVTWIALEQWQRASRYKEVCQLGHPEWTMQQGFYVDMGGLQVVLPGDKPQLQTQKGNTNIVELEDEARYTIRLNDLIVLIKADVLTLPDMTIDELKERSKNDQFARVVTSFQVLYFVIRSFGRLGSGLPLSTLEISTLAFICCAIFIEYFWWNKPLDLRSSTVTTISPLNRPRFISLLPTLRLDFTEQDLAEKIDLKLFFERITEGDEMKRNVIHAVWIGCIFNGIHISAWNYSFPTELERLLWQIASVVACATVALLWAATFLKPRVLGFALAALSAILYVICRVYLMVEVFLSLRSVPPALYQSAEWQNALPGV